jgi:hypothetical protein
MGKSSFLLWGPIVVVLVLVLAKYLLELRNYETLKADPCLLKSPNECASQ